MSVTCVYVDPARSALQGWGWGLLGNSIRKITIHQPINFTAILDSSSPLWWGHVPKDEADPSQGREGTTAFAGITLVIRPWLKVRLSSGLAVRVLNSTQSEIKLNVVASSFDTAGHKRMVKDCKETDVFRALPLCLCEFLDTVRHCDPPPHANPADTGNLHFFPSFLPSMTPWRFHFPLVFFFARLWSLGNIKVLISATKSVQRLAMGQT